MNTQPEAPVVTHPVWLLLERIVGTFVEVFITAWLASGQMGFTGWQQWALAGFAAVGTVIANGTPDGTSLPFYTDLLYRVLRTYAVSFLTLFGGGVAVGVAPELSAEAAQAAAWAALPAVLTVVKSMLARRFVGVTDRNSPTTGTAAVLPARRDTPPPYTAAA